MRRRGRRARLPALWNPEQLEELFLQDEQAKAAFRRREARRLVLAWVLVLAFVAAACAAAGAEQRTEAGRYLRPSVQEGERTQPLRYVLSKGETRIEVRQDLALYPRDYSEEEAGHFLDLAEAWLDEVVPGENPSLAEVSEDLYLPEAAEGLPVTIRWKTDRNWFRYDGELRDDIRVTEEAHCLLQAELTCSGQTRILQIPLTLVPRERSEQELAAEEAAGKVQEEEAAQRQSDYYELPERLDGWAVETKESPSPLRYLYLMIPAAAILLLWGKARLSQECRRRREVLAEEYPVFVDQLLLYVRAGLSIYSAWEKVRSGFESRGRYPYLTAEMQAAEHEMNNGVPVADALENFGRRTGVLPYRRFAFLAGQNLMRGTRNLPGLLEYEAREAMEKKKNELQRKGEEAGTKLLFPMMLLLLIVLVLVLVPALLQL